MKVLIFEDEKFTADRLVQLIKRYDSGIEILEILTSVKQGIDYLSKHVAPDLIFMDIHLTDGSGFDIFDDVNVEAPIIFTTAYDEYALKAFKLNSIDYLVKPVDFNDLKSALDKFFRLQHVQSFPNSDHYKNIFKEISSKYKKRFLVKINEQFRFVQTKEMAYCYFDHGIVYACTTSGSKWPLDFTLEQMEKLLDPEQFTRINRGYIVNIDSIKKIHAYFNSRLKLELDPEPGEDVIVSRERVKAFKEWLGQ